MTISFQTEQWLAGAGYYHYVFVSWPRSEIHARFAQAIAKEIDNQLSLMVGPLVPAEPRVFLEIKDLAPGIDWKDFLPDRLCRSIVMVALCSEIYYKPYHQYCGFEWAAMEQLGKVRLPGTALAAIQPILLQKTNPLPPPIEAIQYLDLSGIVTASTNFSKTHGFKKVMASVVAHIAKVAGLFHRNDVKPGCDGFKFPLQPADFGHIQQAEFPRLAPPEASLRT